MAKVTRATKTVTRTVTEDVPNGFNLHISAEEASALRGVLGDLSAGSAVSPIFWALGAAGVSASHHLEARDGRIRVETGAELF